MRVLERQGGMLILGRVRGIAGHSGSFRKSHPAEEGLEAGVGAERLPDSACADRGQTRCTLLIGRFEHSHRFVLLAKPDVQGGEIQGRDSGLLRPLLIETGRRSGALARDSSQDHRNGLSKPHDLKQIEFLDTTRMHSRAFSLVVHQALFVLHPGPGAPGLAPAPGTDARRVGEHLATSVTQLGSGGGLLSPAVLPAHAGRIRPHPAEHRRAGLRQTTGQTPAHRAGAILASGKREAAMVAAGAPQSISRSELAAAHHGGAGADSR